MLKFILGEQLSSYFNKNPFDFMIILILLTFFIFWFLDYKKKEDYIFSYTAYDKKDKEFVGNALITIKGPINKNHFRAIEKDLEKHINKEEPDKQVEHLVITFFKKL